MLELAASLTGRNQSDFVRASVEKEARQVIKDYKEMKLSKRDSEALAEALINPPEPSQHLKEAAERYKENIDR